MTRVKIFYYIFIEIEGELIARSAPINNQTHFIINDFPLNIYLSIVKTYYLG